MSISKRKRGRPRNQSQFREPNGRVARSKQEDYNRTVERRARYYGISTELAKDPRSATLLGRLFLCRIITENQYLAGQEYLRRYENYQCAIGSPSAYYESNLGLGTKDEHWIARAIQQFDEAIYSVDCRTRGLLDQVVISQTAGWWVVDKIGLALDKLEKVLFPHKRK